MNAVGKYTQFYLDQLRKELLGGKIVGTVVDTETESGYSAQFFGLIVAMPSGKRKIVWFLRDDEANGPGSFEIVEE